MTFEALLIFLVQRFRLVGAFGPPTIRGPCRTISSYGSSSSSGNRHLTYLGAAPPVLNDFNALVWTIPTITRQPSDSYGHDQAMSLFQSSVSVSSGAIDSHNLPSALIIPSIFLLGAISAFLYANLVYTPEILENAEHIRLEQREEEIHRILQLVQERLEENERGEIDTKEDLRKSLEYALDMPLEDYVRCVQQYTSPQSARDMPAESRIFTTADAKLAALLESKIIQ